MSMSNEHAIWAIETGRKQFDALTESLGELHYLCRSFTTGGLLSQFWLPSTSPDGICLLTRDTPYALLGNGDMLALYRCYSCRYKFLTDFSRPELMGAPGRVLVTGEPEMTHNVQAYPKSTYGRVDVAKRCKIYSTMVLPLYLVADDSDCAFGVIEIMSMDRHLSFMELLDRIQHALNKHDLRTVDRSSTAMHMGLRLVKDLPASPVVKSGNPSDSTAGASRHAHTRYSREEVGASGALLGGPRGQANPQRRPELEGRSGAGEGLQAGWQPPEGIGGAQKEWWVQVGDDGGINIVSGSMHEGSAHGELLWKAIEKSKREHGSAMELRPDAPLPPLFPVVGPEGAHERPGSEEGLDGDEGAQGASAEDGAGSNFVGKRLTLADLEPHFHLGLREAAAALGVAPTTLKRVCRRLGIPKWPRRELQRLTRQGAGDVSAVDVALGKHEQTGEDPESHAQVGHPSHGSGPANFRLTGRQRIVPFSTPAGTSGPPPILPALSPGAAQAPILPAGTWTGAVGALPTLPGPTPPGQMMGSGVTSSGMQSTVPLGGTLGMDLDLEDDIAPLLDNDFLSDFLRDVQNLRGVSQNES